MALTPHSFAVLVVLAAFVFALCCSRIPFVGPVVCAALVMGVAAGVAGVALAHGLV